MTTVDPAYFLALAALMFTIGTVGVLVRRNAIVIFMFVELMLNAVNLAFVTFARMQGNIDGQIIVFFVLVVAAAEVVVGLAIILLIARRRGSANVDDVSLNRVRHATVILPHGADWNAETEGLRDAEAGLPVAWEMKPMRQPELEPAPEIGG